MPCVKRVYVQPGPFVLAIKVQIKPELREEWLQQWKVLAKHVRENEPKTLAYEVSEVEGQENTFLVYERSASLVSSACVLWRWCRMLFFLEQHQNIDSHGMLIFDVLGFHSSAVSFAHAGTALRQTCMTRISNQSLSRASNNGARKQIPTWARRYVSAARENVCIIM